MAEIVLTKTPMGTLAPVDQTGVEYIAKLKVGAGVKATVKRENNLQFHKKMFALANLAFDSWEPEEKTHKGIPIKKNFDQFREDITILAGFYETSIRLNGDIRFKAKSWSFASMEDDEKERLYSAIIDVVLSRVLTKYTRENLDEVIEKLLRFS
jgi:hypothetical protein